MCFKRPFRVCSASKVIVIYLKCVRCSTGRQHCSFESRETGMHVWQGGRVDGRCRYRGIGVGVRKVDDRLSV